ncbi:SET domain protein [Oesophagostomum dentatum]|uniref:[histone H3]-lysine(27) N-trimethyltransferase n=1 Tax=Oesophagostomum dentatum TaxID=61180 RepID=A0A0B1ST66_OESDE|nr:SET domain protein [Oesophagostomum dentatum]
MVKGSVVATFQVENKERMIPCSHNGHCDGNPLCVCSSGSGICSKFCGCPQDCRMRFPGCRCAPGNCRTKQCQCYFARWECDPDLCKSCKCDDLSMEGEKCRNVPLQRGHQKLLKVGISGIAGWGCFIQETADKGDLIAEYTGEVISKWESERRGLIYDKFCTSYIFGMNNDQFIDATRVGNLIRFANHSNTNANCSSEIKIVNGEHRIGVYASRHILFGEELLFDYNYGQTWNKFVPIEKNDLSMEGEKCRNVPLQRGHQKLLKVGISGIAGWGCFIQETADKGDLIAEYTGEVISKWESERRGLIYDKFCTSYIFGMNNDQFIDATRVGNLIRFANHSNTNANCSSEIKIVNGEHRIGVYASRHILFGEELLFDYNYGQTWNKFVPIEKSIRAQANRSTPDSDCSRTGASQNKPEKLRRSVLKKTVKGEPRLSEGGKIDSAKHDDGSHKNGKQKTKMHKKV